MSVEGGKELVTESAVRAMPRGGELVLGAQRIATPAAIDLTFQKGIRVRFCDSPSPPQAGAAAGGTDLWQRMRASDGTFVVIIKNGRATVSRLSERGPEHFGEESS